MVSSNGDFTGFLNLTIERAPTNPRDNARLLDITEVTENVIMGNKYIDRVWEKVLIQFWLLIIKHCLIKDEKIINNKTDSNIEGFWFNKLRKNCML